MKDPSARISPTAHYTGYIWYHHGISHPALRTRTGAVLFRALQPINRLYDRLRGPTLEGLLLSRHAAIDAVLDEAIETGLVGQVLEVAAGLSPRGWRLTGRHPGLTYVEGDLLSMSQRKRRALDAAGLDRPGPEVVHLDALLDTGARSLAAVAEAHLDPALGTAIVTEGLVNYFDGATIAALWRRIARVLAAFPRGLYLSDIHLRRATYAHRVARVFAAGLQVFARGRIHMHFEDPPECVAALREAGFATARVEHPSAFGVQASAPEVVHVIRAEARPKLPAPLGDATVQA